MVKRFSGFLAAMLIILIMLSGCGASTNKSSNSQAEAPKGAELADYSMANGDAKSKVEYDKNVGDNVKVQFSESVGAEPAAVTATSGQVEKDNGQTAIVATGANNESLANAILDQRKVIRNANVSIIVDSYENTYGKIQSLVEGAGNGYIQESRVSKQGSYGKSGMIIVRVDADKFSQILNNVKGLGEVIDAMESTDDITEKFYDTESELRLLKYEQSRLEEYLKKIDDPDTIFKTESRLTDIRHQIENLTGTLNKLSNLVKLSTITINISEKSVKNIDKEKTYLEKLFGGFTDSMKGVGNFFGELILLLVALIPTLVILALCAWIIWIFYRKYRKNNEEKSKIKIKDE
jgi:hypothetical protein